VAYSYHLNIHKPETYLSYDKNLGRTTPQMLAVIVENPKGLQII